MSLFIDQYDCPESEFCEEVRDEVGDNDGATRISTSLPDSEVGCLSDATDGTAWAFRELRVQASRTGEGGVIDIRNFCGDQDECAGGGACHLEEGSIYMPEQLGHCAPVDCLG